MSSSKLTLSKASLVGAKRVKGPAEARVSTRPAAFTAANKVENLKKPRISGKHFQILDALLGIRQERVAQFSLGRLKLTLTTTFAVKSPGISGDNVCDALVWNERVDDFGHQVDNSVARVDVKCPDPLSVDRNKTLGENQG